MTVARADSSADHDTPSACTTQGRLLTPAHKVTGCGEFTRRSDVLQAYAVSGRQLLQAVGAWHQLWTAHSRSDGTVWLTAEQVCAQLRISRPLWVELAGLLEAAGLLAPHGARYVVPDAQVLEGLGRHYTPGGWRSLHRETYRAAVVDRLDVNGPQRLAILGVLAWVLLRHTAVRGTAVHRTAKAELARMLDPRTLRSYLGHLAGVLDCPSRGRLRLLARTVLERPLSPDTPSPVSSPSNRPDRPAASHPAGRSSPDPADDQKSPLGSEFTGPSSPENAPSAACLGQEPLQVRTTYPDGPRENRPPVLPAWGSRDGTEHPRLGTLVARLDEHASGAWEIQARPDVRRILSAALWSLEGNVGALVDALCADPFTGARTIPGLLRSRAPIATERVLRRWAARDLQARAERAATAYQDQLRQQRAARAHAAALHAAEQDRADQLETRLDHPDVADLRQQLHEQTRPRLGRFAGPVATAAATRAAVLAAAAPDVDPTTLPVARLRELLRTAIAAGNQRSTAQPVGEELSVVVLHFSGWGSTGVIERATWRAATVSPPRRQTRP